MPGRSGGGRNLPFDVLSGDAHTRLSRLESDSLLDNGEKEGAVPTRRRRKAKRKRRTLVAPERAASEDPSHMVEPANEKPKEFETFHLVNGNCVRFSGKISVVEKLWENAVVKADHEDSSPISCVSFAELMQRDAIGCVDLEQRDEVMSARDGSDGEQCPATSNEDVPALTKQESCNLNGAMEDGLNFKKEASFMEKLPFKYFMGEIYGGSSLRGTVSAGNAKKRQRVYNTMFHVPWRCERVILAGFFVCLDSFLSLLTIMPARIAMAIWRVLNTRRLWRPSAAELSDFGCFIVLAFGVASLQLADISLIYHFIRGQGTIKLYVVYNVLEIFDKLFQSFGEDVLQVLFDSAERLSTCPPDNLTFELIRFIFDEVIAVIAFGIHSFVLLAQAITLATCIIAHNNALLALLVSNNFAEIKSNVFKKISKDNLHHLVYYDIVERFHITAFVLFVLAQNILEAEGPWFESFLCNVLMVYMCEVLVDAIKHSFLAKFNEIKPFAYSEFLEDLSKQTLNEKPDDRRKDLTFIPLALACVVIRVLTPVYANLLPSGPLPRRLLWIFVWSNLTYFILLSWKIFIGTSLRRLAAWYIKLRRDKKHHAD